MTIDTLLQKMWADYVEISPDSQVIHDLFTERGDTVNNDHIALRTFQHSRLGIDQMAAPFIEMGYAAQGEYHFEKKKLFARHFEHKNSKLPKIFISELLVDQFSSFLQEKVHDIVEQITDDNLSRPDFTCLGRLWDISFSDYTKLSDESEYAGWLSAFGFRPNHFTVSINDLNSFDSVSDINVFLKEKGFGLNSSGGEIKGNPEQKLEQSSTLAQSVNVDFSDGPQSVPSCYYEFAKRYPLQNGQLYQGFVAASADKIFESTDRQ